MLRLSVLLGGLVPFHPSETPAVPKAGPSLGRQTPLQWFPRRWTVRYSAALTVSAQ